MTGRDADRDRLVCDAVLPIVSGLLLGALLWWGIGAFLVGLALRVTLSLRFGKVA